MNLESIRKVWVLLGSVIMMLGATLKLPAFVIDLFGETGTQLVFSAIGAVLALIQWSKSRTGEKKGITAQSTAPLRYWLPWKAAA